jgi:hypothetical protein
VQKLTAGLGDHRANTAFGHAILMMGADARDSQMLMIIFDFLEEFQFSKDAIVGAVPGDNDVTRQSETLKSELRTNGVLSTKGDLKVDLGKARGNINENGATTEFLNILLASARLEQAATLRHFELINGDLVARGELPMLDTTNGFSASSGPSGTSGATDLLGVCARSTTGTLSVTQGGNAG